MPHQPLFSVIIPCYNAEATLGEAVASVLQQTCQDFEILVIDDSSEDGSSAVAARMSEQDPRVRLLNARHGGVSRTRNLGLDQARGSFVAFLDADDLWLPEKLEHHRRHFRREPQTGVSFTRVRYLSPEGTPLGRRSARPGRVSAASLLRGNPATTTSSIAARREVVEEVGGFDQSMSFAEDLEWLLRVCCRSSWQIRGLAAALTLYRTSPGGLSARLDEMEIGWITLAGRVRRYAPEIVDRHFDASHASQLLYLARHSLRLGRPAAEAQTRWQRALIRCPSIALRAPVKVLGVGAGLLARKARERFSKNGAEARGGDRGVHLTMDPKRVTPRQEKAAKPELSVVVPAYNSENTLPATIRSVLAQTFQNFELILVDDGSTDRTPEICDSIHDPRIRTVHQANRGLAGARNTGIREAVGDFIAFLDADDLWLPGKLEAHRRHLRRSPEVGVSFCPSLFIDETGTPIGYRQKPRLRGIDPQTLLCRNPVGNGSAPVVRREALLQIAFQGESLGHDDLCFFDESFRQSEDIECWVRLAATTSWRFEGIPEPLTLYRVHSGGLSADIDAQYAIWCRFLEKARHSAPRLVARWGQLARAFQLRYLARRAVRSRDGRLALRLAGAALAADWRVAVREPVRTATTLAAAALLAFVPVRVYGRLEGLAMTLSR